MAGAKEREEAARSEANLARTRIEMLAAENQRLTTNQAKLQDQIRALTEA
jgi:FtsZ-binding cell division protein ZapB